MTVLALAEMVQQSLSRVASNLDVERHGGSTIVTAVIGDQSFTITVQELPKDRDEPAIT
jgi:hypothetical protein